MVIFLQPGSQVRSEHLPVAFKDPTPDFFSQSNGIKVVLFFTFFVHKIPLLNPLNWQIVCVYFTVTVFLPESCET